MTGVWKAVTVVNFCRPVVQTAIRTTKVVASTPGRTLFAELECCRQPLLVVILLIGGCRRGERWRQTEPSSGHDEGSSGGAGLSKMMGGAV